MEKKIKLQAEQIGEIWYVTGEGLKMPMPTEGYANIVSKLLMTLDVPNPNFTPGRRKKSV
jgi:hypothetical protein